jgi:hypothetical protein
MGTSRLPSELLADADLRGNEYAWPLAKVPQVIRTAREHGLAVLGGQLQFRLSEGICELYWLSADSEDRKAHERWPEYVERSASEVLNRFQQLQSSSDFISEGRMTFTQLEELYLGGVDLTQFLCFVLYFEDEISHALLVAEHTRLRQRDLD